MAFQDADDHGSWDRLSSALKADESLISNRVIAVLERLCEQGGDLPRRLHMDNGTKFTYKALDAKAYEHAPALNSVAWVSLRKSPMWRVSMDIFEMNT